LTEDEARDCVFAICKLTDIHWLRYSNGCVELWAPLWSKFVFNGCVNLTKEPGLKKDRNAYTWPQMLDALNMGFEPCPPSECVPGGIIPIQTVMHKPGRIFENR
jgi:hypothetical protein